MEAYQRLPNRREPAAFPTWLRLIVRQRADRPHRSAIHQAAEPSPVKEAYPIHTPLTFSR